VYNRRHRSMKLTKAFAQQSRTWILAEVAGALLVIGFLDFVTGYQFRLLPLYPAPIFVAGWFFRRGIGIGTALVSAVIWWCANWFNGEPDLHSWVQPWDIAYHVSFFILVAWTAAALRAKSDSATGRIALLEHSRRLEMQIVGISDAEQRRIGQDLHDGVCQVLAALSCSATELRGDLEKRGLPEQAKSAGELARLLQSAVVETRDLARSLVPTHVSEVGLSLALESLAQSVSRLHRINCTFRSSGGEIDRNDAVATHLYRIAQEAINNAAGHGKAKNITVALEAADHGVLLRVADDGGGIPDAPVSNNGIGLAVMRYRAHLSGGELAVESPPSGGTVVSCTAKINGAQHEVVAA
jgi:signal transduction histidine kinase